LILNLDLQQNFVIKNKGKKPFWRRRYKQEKIQTDVTEIGRGGWTGSIYALKNV
jgi:hypothetical protein